jgi:hypothetical protein
LDINDAMMKMRKIILKALNLSHLELGRCSAAQVEEIIEEEARNNLKLEMEASKQFCAKRAKLKATPSPHPFSSPKRKPLAVSSCRICKSFRNAVQSTTSRSFIDWLRRLALF